MYIAAPGLPTHYLLIINNIYCYLLFIYLRFSPSPPPPHPHPHFFILSPRTHIFLLFSQESSKLTQTIISTQNDDCFTISLFIVASTFHFLGVNSHEKRYGLKKNEMWKEDSVVESRAKVEKGAVKVNS